MHTSCMGRKHASVETQPSAVSRQLTWQQQQWNHQNISSVIDVHRHVHVHTYLQTCLDFLLSEPPAHRTACIDGPAGHARACVTQGSKCHVLREPTEGILHIYAHTYTYVTKHACSHTRDNTCTHTTKHDTVPGTSNSNPFP
jgi:hypothetical protein